MESSEPVSAIGMALETLFTDPNIGRDAFWRIGGTGGPAPVRVVPRQPDRIESFGETRIQSETARFDVRASEVPNPRPGDTLEIEGEVFVIQGEPVRDSERLVWTLDTRPA
jgi:hypothetical protein